MNKRSGTDMTRAGLEAVYKEQKGGFLAWATTATRNAADAEDILHEVFLRAYANLDALALVENMGAWLFTAIRNRVIDRSRKDENRRRLGETRVAEETLAEIAVATGFDPGDELVREELGGAIAEAIAALPDDQRMVIEAQAFGGETFREISERTGLSINTLTARKRYAVRKLGTALKDWIALD